MPVAHPDRAVVALAGRAAAKPSAQGLERGGVRTRAKRPLPLRVRHEANAVETVAVIEAGRSHAAVFAPEIDVERHVDERIAVFRTGKRGLEKSPFLDLGSHSLLLDRAARETRDEVALEDEVDDRRRQHGHHDRRIELAVVALELALE